MLTASILISISLWAGQADQPLRSQLVQMEFLSQELSALSPHRLPHSL